MKILARAERLRFALDKRRWKYNETDDVTRMEIKALINIYA